MFHHRLPVPPDEKEEEEETYDEINIMRPVYGVTSIEWNYVLYNTSRSKKDQVSFYDTWRLVCILTHIILTNARSPCSIKCI